VACRILGLFLLVVLDERALLRDLAMIAAGLAFIPVSMALFPAANPVSAILSLGGASEHPAAIPVLGAVLPFYLFSVIMSLLAAIVCAAAVCAGLTVVRKARHGASA
jgi:hypothetical protein